MKHLFQNLEGIENMTQIPDAMFVIVPTRRKLRSRKRAAWRAGGFGVDRIAIRTWWTDYSGNDDALRAIRLFTSKISESVAEGKVAYEQSRSRSEGCRGPGTGRRRRIRGHQRLRTIRKAGRRLCWSTTEEARYDGSHSPCGRRQSIRAAYGQE